MCIRETQSDLKKVQAELEATLQVKTQLKNKLKDYRQRMDNLAAVEDKRSQVSETTLSIIQSNLGTLIFFSSKTLHGVWERLEKGRKAHNVSNVLLIHSSFFSACFLFSQLTHNTFSSSFEYFFLPSMLS